MRLAPLLLGALAAAAAAATPSLPAQGIAHSVTRRLDDDDDGGNSCSAAERVVYDIVETMPVGVNLTYRNSIYNVLHTMMTQATRTIDIACFYMELSDGGSSEGAQYGLQLFNDIIDASKRGVRVRIAITSASDSFPQTDAYTLQAMGAAEVRFMDFNAILGGGVLHTKMIIADNATFFVGSANMDWKSFSQVKELGLYGSSSKRLVFQMEQVRVLGRPGRSLGTPRRARGRSLRVGRESPTIHPTHLPSLPAPVADLQHVLAHRRHELHACHVAFVLPERVQLGQPAPRVPERLLGLHRRQRRPARLPTTRSVPPWLCARSLSPLFLHLVFSPRSNVSRDPEMTPPPPRTNSSPPL